MCLGALVGVQSQVGHAMNFQGPSHPQERLLRTWVPKCSRQKMARGDAGCPVLPCSMRKVMGNPDFNYVLWQRGWKRLWKRLTPWVLGYCGSCSASYGIMKYTLDETEKRTLGWYLQHSEEEAGVSVPVVGHRQSDLHTLFVLCDFSYRKASSKNEEVRVPPSLFPYLIILP